MGGYSHCPTEEMCNDFARLSAEQKLQWLFEVNSFLFNVAGSKIRDSWLRLRRGERL